MTYGRRSQRVAKNKSAKLWLLQPISAVVERMKGEQTETRLASFFSWTACSRRLNRFLELDNHFAMGISYLTNSRLFDDGKSLILVQIGEWIASYHEMKRGSLKVADYGHFPWPPILAESYPETPSRVHWLVSIAHKDVSHLTKLKILQCCNSQ